jgi:prepilin-type N-terminal cleavage/methylation domain-containing protein
MTGQDRHGARGFSLVEVLVTLVLIALLAAFLLPRLTGNGKGPLSPERVTAPKRRAEQTVGAVNLSQINTAIQMYRDANEGRNPPSLDALKPYGLTDAMLRDPATQQPLPYDPATGRVGAAGAGAAGGVLPRVPGF